jgi:hypothetical protein
MIVLAVAVATMTVTMIVLAVAVATTTDREAPDQTPDQMCLRGTVPGDTRPCEVSGVLMRLPL